MKFMVNQAYKTFICIKIGFLLYGSWTNKQVVGDQPEHSPHLQRNPP